jgi:hypothetical protein
MGDYTFADEVLRLRATKAQPPQFTAPWTAFAIRYVPSTMPIHVAHPCGQLAAASPLSLASGTVNNGGDWTLTGLVINRHTLMLRGNIAMDNGKYST